MNQNKKLSPDRFMAKAPSNIALIKYWGKSDPIDQIPTNSSLSLTLTHSYTETIASVCSEAEDQVVISGKTLEKKSTSYKRIQKHLDRIRKITNCEKKLFIESVNSFPTGCGIASSASGFAALTIASVACFKNCESFLELCQKGFDLHRLADIARLGSGSACRSFWPGLVHWKHDPLSFQQTYAHEKLQMELCDTIVIVDSKEKQTSSSSGHKLASTSPLFELRVSGIEEKLENLMYHLKNNDLKQAGLLIEAEALDMHATMMTSEPPIVYPSKETHSVLCWLRRMRKEYSLKAFFTLDAGANVHIISQKNDQRQLKLLLNKKFPGYKVIEDENDKCGPKLCKIDGSNS